MSVMCNMAVKWMYVVNAVTRGCLNTPKFKHPQISAILYWIAGRTLPDVAGELNQQCPETAC